ncbi:deoxynucleoside kinase [Candidatus Dependentiae bacterium]|nr:deoxynucleoside kinase [Candidatus Dependentiae bacterium]
MKQEFKKICAAADIKNAKPMIFVEGNVGVGKSSFLHVLNEKLGSHVFYEPNELWQDVDGHNLLEAFFIDQKRWAYALQSYIVMTRVDQMITADTTLCDKVCFVERSVYSGRYIFAEVAKDIGTMNSLEWCLYKKVWDRDIAQIQRPAAGFIYLRTPAEICYNRIIKRGRQEENPITMDYLNRLEQKHENWFIKKIGVPENLAYVPVLVLDFSDNFETSEVMQEQYFDLIVDFINKIDSSDVKK